jgi:hypothetical protein
MRYVRHPPWGPDEAKPFREFREWVATFFEPDEVAADPVAVAVP